MRQIVDRIWRRLAGAAAALLLCGTAFAQTTGTRMNRDATRSDGALAIEVIADCALDRQPGKVRKWLDALPGSTEERKAISALTEDLGTCLGSNQQVVFAGKAVKFHPRALRRPLAAAVALRELRNSGEAGSPNIAADPWFVAKLAGLPTGERIDRPTLIIQDFGHCVAQQRWPATRSFLLSAPGSAEEKAAMQALRPVLPSCLSEGLTLSLQPDNLRVVLAEPVYHILADGRVGAVAKTQGR